MQYSWFQSVKYYTGIISLGVLLGLGLQFAQAWSNPTQSAPNGNVAGPVNLGSGTQVKAGSLGIGGNLSVNGGVRLGVALSGAACDTSTRGTVRFNGSDFQGCVGGTWKSLTSGGTVPKFWCTGETSTGAHYCGECPWPLSGWVVGTC